MTNKNKKNGKGVQEPEAIENNENNENNDDTTLVTFTNSRVFLIPKSNGFVRIMDSLRLDEQTGDKVYELYHVLTDSPKGAAVNDTVKKLATKHKVSRLTDVLMVPEYLIWGEIDSGIEFEKIDIRRSQIEISVRDRVELEFIFNFVSD